MPLDADDDGVPVPSQHAPPAPAVPAPPSAPPLPPPSCFEDMMMQEGDDDRWSSPEPLLAEAFLASAQATKAREKRKKKNDEDDDKDKEEEKEEKKKKTTTTTTTTKTKTMKKMKKSAVAARAPKKREPLGPKSSNIPAAPAKAKPNRADLGEKPTKKKQFDDDDDEMPDWEGDASNDDENRE